LVKEISEILLSATNFKYTWFVLVGWPEFGIA